MKGPMLRYLAILSVLAVCGARASGQPATAQTAPARSVWATPADGGALQVRQAPYNAAGDGLTDDTPALAKALGCAGGRVVYLPEGTYRISQPLVWPKDGTVVMGAGPGRTILRLADASPNFTDAARPQAVLNLGKGAGLMALTLDVGEGNAGAVGVCGNGAAYLADVVIRSAGGEDRGNVGLTLAPGGGSAMTASRIRIEGFDVGVRLTSGQSMLTLIQSNFVAQRYAGAHVTAGVLVAEGLRSSNACPAVICTGGASLVTLVKGELVRTAGPASGPAASTAPVAATAPTTRENSPSAVEPAAVENVDGGLYLRGLRTDKYRTSVRSSVEGRSSEAPGRTVGEFVSHPAVLGLPSPRRSLMLGIVETPAGTGDDVGDWASVTDYGADGSDDQDDTDAIRRAMASGKATIYFPTGCYRLRSTTAVGEKVQRVVGMNSRLVGTGEAGNWGDQPMLRLEGPAGGPLLIEHLTLDGPGACWIEQATPRPVALRHVRAGRYRNSVPGRLMLEGVCGGGWQFRRQSVWARGLEVGPGGSSAAAVVNDGGEVWILGLSAHDVATPVVQTLAGGKTEILGALLGGDGTSTRPLLEAQEASLSASLAVAGRLMRPLVAQTRGEQAVSVGEPMLTARGLKAALPLYVGFLLEDRTPPTAPAKLGGKPVSDSEVRLAWAPAHDRESGVLAYRVYRDGKLHAVTEAPRFVDRGLSDQTEYRYQVTGLNGAMLESPPSEAIAVSTLPDRNPPAIEAACADSGGQGVRVWFSEPLSAEAGGDVSRYSLSGGVEVRSARLEADGRRVWLATGRLSSPSRYTLSVRQMPDRSRSANTADELRKDVVFLPALAAYWPFAEGRGEVTQDLSGAGLEAGLRGATWVKGKVGGGLRIHGPQGPTLADAKSLLGPSFTLACWAWLDGPPGRSVVLLGQGEPGDMGIAMRMTAVESGVEVSGVVDPGSPVSGVGKAKAAAWRHVAMTYDGESQVLTLYVEGKPVATRPGVSRPTRPGGALVMGAFEKPSERGGRLDLDEVMIFGRALSAEEVRELARP